MNGMAYIRIIRPSGCLMVSLIAVTGQLIASGRLPGLSTVTSAFMTGFLMTASSFTINDYLDHEIDAINAPWRPIPSGLMTRDEALRLGVALGLMGSTVSLYTSAAACIVAVGSLLLSILYTVKGKYLGLMGHVMVAICIASSFIFGALAVTAGITPLVLGVFTVSFLYVLGGELTQSISDIEGDLSKGVKSVAILWGRRAAAVGAAVCYVLTAFAGAAVSSVYGSGLGPYTLIFVLGTITLVCFITLPLLRSPEEETARAVRKRINNLAYIIIVLLTASLSTMLSVG